MATAQGAQASNLAAEITSEPSDCPTSATGFSVNAIEITPSVDYQLCEHERVSGTGTRDGCLEVYELCGSFPEDYEEGKLMKEDQHGKTFAKEESSEQAIAQDVADAEGLAKKDSTQITSIDKPRSVEVVARQESELGSPHSGEEDTESSSWTTESWITDDADYDADNYFLSDDGPPQSPNPDSQESPKSTISRLKQELKEQTHAKEFLLQTLKTSNRMKEQIYEELNVMTSHAALQERRLFEALHSVACPQPKSFETRKLLLLQEITIRDLRKEIEEAATNFERAEIEKKQMETKARIDTNEINILKLKNQLLMQDLEYLGRQRYSFEQYIKPYRDMLHVRLDHDHELVREREELRVQLDSERSESEVLQEQIRVCKDQITGLETDVACATEEAKSTQASLESMLVDMTSKRDSMERKLKTLIGLSLYDRTKIAMEMKEEEVAAAYDQIRRQRREIIDLKQIMFVRRIMGYDPRKADEEEQGHEDLSLREHGIQRCPCHPLQEDVPGDSGFKNDDKKNAETFGIAACRELETSQIPSSDCESGGQKVDVCSFSTTIC